MSRRERLLIPAVVAALVAAVVLGLTLFRTDGTHAAKRLPIRLGAAAEAAKSRDSASGTGGAPAAAPYFGGVTYKIVGAEPATPDDAPAYRISSGTPDEALVRRLAAALGISGTVEHKDGMWIVQDANRALRVMDESGQPGLPWYAGNEVRCLAVDSVPPGGPIPPAPSANGKDTPTTARTDAPPPSPSDVKSSPVCGPMVSDSGSVSSGGVAYSGSASSGPGSLSGGSGGGSAGSTGSGTATPTTVLPPSPGPCKTDPSGPQTQKDYCAQPAPDGSPVPEPSPPVLPSESAARAAADKVFAAVGIDATNATIRARKDWGAWSIEADPIIDGLHTSGMTTHVSVGPDLDIQYANGWLGAAKLADRYPVLSLRAALDRLQKNSPVPMIACVRAPCEQTAPSVEVRGAELGLAFTPGIETKDGAYLVPAWLFETNGYVQAAVALPEEYFAPPPVIEPPGPGGSGGGGCSVPGYDPNSTEPPPPAEPTCDPGTGGGTVCSDTAATSAGEPSGPSAKPQPTCEAPAPPPETSPVPPEKPQPATTR